MLCWRHWLREGQLLPVTLGEFPELMDDSSGRLVPAMDSGALAVALDEVLAGSGREMRLGLGISVGGVMWRGMYSRCSRCSSGKGVEREVGICALSHIDDSDLCSRGIRMVLLCVRPIPGTPYTTERGATMNRRVAFCADGTWDGTSNNTNDV